MNTNLKSVAFAYFSNDEFLGWYAGTFGGCSKTGPKLYNDSESQKQVITKNFQSKLKDINETSFDEAKEKTVGLDAIFLFRFDSEVELRGRNVELRVVETPFYDGPNPDFSELVERQSRNQYEALYHLWCDENGLEAGIEPGNIRGIGLLPNYKRFQKAHPQAKGNSWVYADYEKVREWAKETPTEFKETLTEYKI